MKWFRIAAIVCASLTLIIALAIFGIIIQMCTNTSHQRAMDSDPNYNNLLGTYIVICVVQICYITCAFFGYYISFMNWRNNYQMDHLMRRKFILFMFLWTLFSLANAGVAIYCIVKGKEPQEEMSGLYEIFTRYNQDTNCCGIYGPDDWMMVQLRSGMGGGGGGGGFQSLDYGFRQNPSTGKCHLTPPTIPMGCGRKILEELHIALATFAGIMMMQTLVGLASACFAGYSFYFWLEKEVIVIPEDEVSNLIILEPESSTSTQYRGDGGGSHYLGGVGGGGGGSGPYFPPDDGYIHTSFHGSRGPSYLKSGSGSNRTRASTRVDEMPTGYFPTLQAGPLNSQNRPPSGSGGANGGVGVANTNADQPIASGAARSGGPTSQNAASNPTQDPTLAMLSAAGPFDAGSRPGSRMEAGSSHSHRSRYAYKAPTMIQAQSKRVSRRTVVGGSMTKPHSQKHMLHAQEQALGGKVLGEVHVDHNKDGENPDNMADAKGGHHGKKHHATVAIVRNKKAPKPKKFFADNLGSGSGHHGQTGHLAEDIAEMTGNPDIIKHKIDDVVLPVEHGNVFRPPGGYLKALGQRRKEEAILEEEAHMGRGSGSVSGLDAVNILSGLLEPVNVAHAHGKDLKTEERPLIQPHMASAILESPTAGGGSHERAHYLNAGSHQNAHYINAGSHENAHYINAGSHENAHYINAGSHENAHYINSGAHERAHYINTGSHENAHYINTGSHENAHYINAGSHENARYINAGSHQNARYIHPGSHEKAHYIRRGSHEDAHYINAGSHENAHYLHTDPHHHEDTEGHRGSHQNAHYINEAHHHQEAAGSHQNAHYINHEAHQHPGSHHNAHYINHDGAPHHPGSHHNAHYINHDGAPHHPGSHHNAHYINHEAHQHPGSHHNAHYINHDGAPHHPGSHHNAHYINHHDAAAHPGGTSHHSRNIPIGAHENAHYINASLHHPLHHHSFDRSKARWTGSVRTVLIYKNPQPLNEDD